VAMLLKKNNEVPVGTSLFFLVNIVYLAVFTEFYVFFSYEATVSLAKPVNRGLGQT